MFAGADCQKQSAPSSFAISGVFCQMPPKFFNGSEPRFFEDSRPDIPERHRSNEIPVSATVAPPNILLLNSKAGAPRRGVCDVIAFRIVIENIYH